MALLYLDHDLDAALSDLLALLGHDALRTREVGRQRAGDEEQIVYAMQTGRILVTYNRDHFRILQRAWRYWADVWSVQPRPMHPGIIGAPQPASMPSERLAKEIDRLLASSEPLTNRYLEWVPGRGWTLMG